MRRLSVYLVHQDVRGGSRISGVRMKPKPSRTTKDQPVIGGELDLALDPNHELVRLATKLPWEDLTAAFGRLYVPDLGRPGIPIRLMAGLHLLKHTYGLSDADVVKGWVEKLLQVTIDAGKATGTITEQSFEKVITDTTVQPKAVQHPTDARLYRKVHAAMLRIAGAEGIKLRQSYRNLMEWGFRKHGGHAKAKQFKRARKVLKSLKTMAGQLTGCGAEDRRSGLPEAQGHADPFRADPHSEANDEGQGLQPACARVECIAKGKAHKPYEFGVKASLAVTHKEGFVVGAMSCPENPYDGHTLEGQLDQVERLTGHIPATTFVDKGYKGHGFDPGRSVVLISGTRKLSTMLKRDLRQRAAIEPELGLMKSDGLLGRNFLKGVVGDSQNIILSGAGQNMRKILAHLRALLRLRIGELRRIVEAIIALLEADSIPQQALVAAQSPAWIFSGPTTLLT